MHTFKGKSTNIKKNPMNNKKHIDILLHHDARNNNVLRAVSFTSNHPQLSMSHLKDEDEDALEGGTVMSGWQLSPGRLGGILV